MSTEKEMPHLVLIQSSLNPNSRTAAVIDKTVDYLEKTNISYDVMDLRDYDIPFCDGRSLSEYGGDVHALHERLKKADGYIIGYPVYLYTISGVLKNFLDILSGPMTGKFFGIIANAGGSNGYMSSNDLISFMHYDIDATAVMPQVYSYKKHFERNIDGTYTLIGSKPLEKIEQMVDVLVDKVSKTQRIVV